MAKFVDQLYLLRFEFPEAEAILQKSCSFSMKVLANIFGLKSVATSHTRFAAYGTSRNVD